MWRLRLAIPQGVAGEPQNCASASASRLRQGANSCVSFVKIWKTTMDVLTPILVAVLGLWVGDCGSDGLCCTLELGARAILVAVFGLRKCVTEARRAIIFARILLVKILSIFGMRFQRDGDVEGIEGGIKRTRIVGRLHASWLQRHHASWLPRLGG